MSAATAVRARLLDLSTVTALVGPRIYGVKLPQTPVLPAIRIQRVSETEFMHLRGADAIYRTRVQIDSVSSEATVADPVTQAMSVDAAIRGDGATTGLVGWRGVAGGVRVTGVLPAGVREGYDADELRQFKVMRDVWVWFTT